MVELSVRETVLGQFSTLNIFALQMSAAESCVLVMTAGWLAARNDLSRKKRSEMGRGDDYFKWIRVRRD